MNPTLQNAILAFQAGRLHDAEQFCRQSLQQDPLNPQTLNLMGALAGLAGRHDVAVELMRKSVALAPHQLMFRRNLATALISNDELDEAETTVREGLELNPDAAKLIALLGLVLAKKGDVDAGRKELTRARDRPNIGTRAFQLGRN